jgi:hypothetical protein
MSPTPSIAGFSASDLEAIQQDDRAVAVTIHDPDCPRLRGERCTCKPQVVIVPKREQLQ